MSWRRVDTSKIQYVVFCLDRNMYLRELRYPCGAREYCKPIVSWTYDIKIAKKFSLRSFAVTYADLLRYEFICKHDPNIEAWTSEETI